MGQHSPQTHFAKQFSEISVLSKVHPSTTATRCTHGRGIAWLDFVVCGQPHGPT
jgi:hypothetical protein